MTDTTRDDLIERAREVTGCLDFHDQQLYPCSDYRSPNGVCELHAAIARALADYADERALAELRWCRELASTHVGDEGDGCLDGSVPDKIAERIRALKSRPVEEKP